jgi:hypothetical protein
MGVWCDAMSGGERAREKDPFATESDRVRNLRSVNSELKDPFVDDADDADDADDEGVDEDVDEDNDKMAFGSI